MDKCEFCEGVIKLRRVLARFRYNEYTIYIKNVPACVCNKCGELYYDAPIYKRLEKIAQQGESSKDDIFPTCSIKDGSSLNKNVQ